MRLPRSFPVRRVYVVIMQEGAPVDGNLTIRVETYARLSDAQERAKRFDGDAHVVTNELRRKLP